jgi:hypothetical protein
MKFNICNIEKYVEKNLLGITLMTRKNPLQYPINVAWNIQNPLDTSQ